jgi:hypothetical protein
MAWWPAGDPNQGPSLGSAPEIVDLDALLYIVRVLFILMVIQIGLSFDKAPQPLTFEEF